MARGIDAVLQVLPGGLYDIQVGVDGDLLTEDSFDAAIIVSLLSDRRANEAEVLESHRRRGWIGNESTPDFEIGSKLWLFEQSRLTPAVQSSLADAAKEALQWLVDEGFADAIVEASVTRTTDQVTLEVVIERPNSQVEKRHFDLWQKTGV